MLKTNTTGKGISRETADYSDTKTNRFDENLPAADPLVFTKNKNHST
jgi:hypothetical protein